MSCECVLMCHTNNIEYNISFRETGMILPNHSLNLHTNSCHAPKALVSKGRHHSTECNTIYGYMPPPALCEEPRKEGDRVRVEPRHPVAPGVVAKPCAIFTDVPVFVFVLLGVTYKQICTAKKCGNGQPSRPSRVGLPPRATECNVHMGR